MFDKRKEIAELVLAFWGKVGYELLAHTLVNVLVLFADEGLLPDCGLHH